MGFKRQMRETKERIRSPKIIQHKRISEKEKRALQLSKVFEEQDNDMNDEDESNISENLNSIGKMSTYDYTEEETIKFKKPKKNESLRNKVNLDIDALEAEVGLGAGDVGSRSDERIQNQERIEAENRKYAYQSAYDETSNALGREQINSIQTEEDDDSFVFGDDDNELRKSLEKARKILGTSTNDSPPHNSNHDVSAGGENKVVFTEMDEYVWGLQIDEDAQKKPDREDDVFMELEDAIYIPDHEMKDAAEVKETAQVEMMMVAKEKQDLRNRDETLINEYNSGAGKGLGGALKLLKHGGTLNKETIYDNSSILIQRTDEYGRILTPKESFRLLSHKFHGKGPGKMKQEKRMRQYQEELKVKQMKNADVSVERTREAQAKLQTPYLVLSGHVKQLIPKLHGFATVEKDLAGGLTPMLGNRKKLEHFLNIKRKSQPGDAAAAQKKPKPW